MTDIEATPELTPTFDSSDRSFLGHPKGLGYLAFTEAWERFSFYGMQALLVLFIFPHHLLMDFALSATASAALVRVVATPLPLLMVLPRQVLCGRDARPRNVARSG